uniref:Pantothenate synthetase n=1 Tax=uncultured Nocardioidaceae bacterium TaxID=253824 RepID=A0A6J4L355_9ACTN|nr:MAG: Pantoate--beta-alanine ligase [uncultured Nocardioidaceae bacterium]
MTPALVRTNQELDSVLMPAHLASAPVALVPTMGALHDGHRALMREARIVADVVVTSVFVNPTQFAPGEDLERYPRELSADLELCASESVDIVFAPGVDQVYPEGTSGGITVDPGELGRILEGAARPTHFRGVLTVLTKLFALVGPSQVLLGEKDYQQLALVRAMVRDFCSSEQVIAVPTVREAGGLAMSSRNRYLTEEQRVQAGALHQALQAGQQCAPEGAGAVLSAAGDVLRAAEAVSVDYVALTDPDLGPAPTCGPARLLLAVTVGGVRLIDNISVDLGADPGGA